MARSYVPLLRPRFIPFDVMSDAERVEHMRGLHAGHGLTVPTGRQDIVRDHADCHLNYCPTVPHTHDKPWVGGR